MFIDNKINLAFNNSIFELYKHKCQKKRKN